MARLVNDPSEFAEESIAGFVSAHPGLVRRVDGGVARAGEPEAGKVAVVIGGGSGHYPAFGGLVGHGLADGAALGNIFASPSAQQVYSVARAVDSGAGVLLTFGNYMGDVLNFTQAQERLIAEGIECVSVAVTDDIASAPSAEADKRRGIAGDLVVFKIAGAVAEAGGTLAEVEAAARSANDRTRSFGVAFSGLRLPGATHALFEVPDGRMAVGMGIHGEPGLRETSLPTADELAELLTTELLAERPDDVDRTEQPRIAVILNGLGSVKSEELFVVYRRVGQLLEDAGYVIVEPVVGELVTSFEMAGVSLTFVWLDERLEAAWTAPATSAAFRRGHGGDERARPLVDRVPEPASAASVQPRATEASADAATAVLTCLEAMHSAIDENVDMLGRLDSVAGDGDHGIGMQRGAAAAARAARDAVADGAGAGTTLSRAAYAWSDQAGGTSGLLWGIILGRLGSALGDSETPTLSAIARGIAEGEREVKRFGKASVGDKTLVDVLSPLAESLTDSAIRELTLADAVSLAADVAESSALATADLLPRVGRARPHAEKSLGTPDPGAHSLALLIRTVQHVLVEREKSA